MYLIHSYDCYLIECDNELIKKKKNNLHCHLDAKTSHHKTNHLSWYMVFKLIKLIIIHIITLNFIFNLIKTL